MAVADVVALSSVVYLVASPCPLVFISFSSIVSLNDRYNNVSFMFSNLDSLKVLSIPRLKCIRWLFFSTQMGSRKFGSFVLFSFVLTAILQLSALLSAPAFAKKLPTGPYAFLGLVTYFFYSKCLKI